MLLHVVDRVLQSNRIERVVVATTTNPADEPVAALLAGYHPRVSVFRGSEDDVLDRYYQAALQIQAETIVRVTSDSPLTDPEIIDRVIGEFLNEPDLDYAATSIGAHTFPRGTNVEALRFSVLEKLWRTTTEKIDREHVTIHIKRFPEKFRTKSIQNSQDLSFHRWTVDEEADYNLVKIIYDRLYAQKPNFRMADVLKLFAEDPDLIKINRHVAQRNVGY